MSEPYPNHTFGRFRCLCSILPYRHEIAIKAQGAASAPRPANLTGGYDMRAEEKVMGALAGFVIRYHKVIPIVGLILS